jgi:hypothetical protein
MYSDSLIPVIPSNANSCNRDGPATAWLMSERSETLYLFQKYSYMICWEHEEIVSRSRVASVKVTFDVFFYHLFLFTNFDTPLRLLFKRNRMILRVLRQFLKRLQLRALSCPDRYTAKPQVI